MAKSRVAQQQQASGMDHRAPESQRPEWAPPQGVTVGAAHDPAEHQADALAAQVLRKLSRPGGSGGGAPAAPHADGCRDDTVHRAARGGAMAGEFEADAKTSADLRGRIGKGQELDGPLLGQLERGFEHSLSGVKVHTDPGAGRLADSLGAEAFTHGRDVFFGPGRFDPQSESGQSLLVHELAHVVQGGGNQPVRRKLKGTLSAVEEGKGKAGGGEKFFRTDYAKILAKLKEFEKREDKVLAQKNFGKLGKDRFWMEKTLRDTIKMIDEWLADNDKFGDEKKRSDRNIEMWNEHANPYEAAIRNDDDAERERMDKMMKGGKTSQRARALAMVRPRLAAELHDIADPVSYFQGKQLSDTNLDKTSGYTKDDAVGGAQNRLDRVQYQDGKKGYFIGEKSNNLTIAQGAFSSKIDQVDPQMGARSVASSRLAKLFGATEIVDVQFAVHSSTTNIQGKPLKESLTKLGVVSEAAEGSEAAALRYSGNESERKDLESRGEKSKVVNISDPTLQRSLNVLQMLDYISLQLDRHTKNFYIATDANGKVLGVKGIDLDISFGKLGKGGDVEADKGNGHFVGVPQLADAKFRQKVLTVSADEIKKCLDGLISPSEVSACLERFAHLQKVMREIDPKKIVQEGGWGDETAKEQIGQKNYVDKLRQGTVAYEYADYADEMTRKLDNDEREGIRKHVRPLVDKGTLSVGHGKAIVKVASNSFATSPFWERVREARNMSNVERQQANAAYDKLLSDKKALTPDQDSKDLDEQIMTADLARQEKAALNSAKGKEHLEAVETFLKGLVDYTIRRASRQKPKMPERRPSLGSHRSSTGVKV
jgi:hypothetical protein